jgi:hypothetical protein
MPMLFYVLTTLSRFLHVLGAAVGLGGLVAAMIVVPRIKDVETRESVTRQLGKWIGIFLTVAVITGFINLYRGNAWHSAPEYHLCGDLKVIAGVGAYALSMLVFHPNKAFARFRPGKGKTLAVAVVLAVIAVLLGSIMHEYYAPDDSFGGGGD